MLLPAGRASLAFDGSDNSICFNNQPERNFMKRILITVLLGTLPLTIFAAKTPNAVIVPAQDIKWEAVKDFPGVYMATVEGNAGKGAHHSYMKFDAGFAAPLHHHTSDHTVTVIAGTLVLTVDEVEHKLPPGSYFSFKKKQPHLTACAPGAECIIFADVRGKWDVVPAKK